MAGGREIWASLLKLLPISDKAGDNGCIPHLNLKMFGHTLQTDISCLQPSPDDSILVIISSTSIKIKGQLLHLKCLK